MLSLDARNEAVAKHLTDFLKKTDRYAKTIDFCADEEHATLPEQQRIVAHLDGGQALADSLGALQAEEAAEPDALPPAVLAKAFAGQL